MKKILVYSLMFINLAPQIKVLGIPRFPNSYRCEHTKCEKKNEVKRSQKIPLIGMIVLLVAVLTASTLSRNKR